MRSPLIAFAVALIVWSASGLAQVPAATQSPTPPQQTQTSDPTSAAAAAPAASTPMSAATTLASPPTTTPSAIVVKSSEGWRSWSDWVFNLLLVIATGVQARVAWRQRDIMSAQTRLMKGELEAATQSAAAAKVSADTAYRTLVDTYPPRIVVREVDLMESGLLLQKARSHSVAEDAHYRAITELTGSFKIINKGRHGATIRFVDGTFYVGRTLPPTNPSNDKRLVDGDLPVEAGYVAITPLPPLAVVTAQLDMIRYGDLTLYVIGKVFYVDEFGHARRTGFARAYNYDTGRFTMVKDEPDYEYVD